MRASQAPGATSSTPLIPKTIHGRSGKYAVLAPATPPPRPERISAFVNDGLIVRNLTDCKNVVNTGLEGAKADLSWDNRHLAFHAPKADAKEGYEIKIVDLERRTVRTLTGQGSSLFPSWTRDRRLCFRHEGDDYNGFMMASKVLSLPVQPLPPPRRMTSTGPPKTLTWSELFPETPLPSPQKT